MHVIVLPCHAVLLDGPASVDDASRWALAPFQAGEHVVFLQHILAAIGLLAKYIGNKHVCDDGGAVLVISGGQTNARAGPRSEAEGYLMAAHERGWFACC